MSRVQRKTRFPGGRVRRARKTRESINYYIILCVKHCVRAKCVQTVIIDILLYACEGVGGENAQRRYYSIDSVDFGMNKGMG